ncbi:hypothetical protein IW262DRAFT_1418013 [Armillaria fumosa]|nr:hypothetical protein IW262DRAFT_1418013 [Armillaria fumosa]
MVCDLYLISSCTSLTCISLLQADYRRQRSTTRSFSTPHIPTGLAISPRFLLPRLRWPPCSSFACRSRRNPHFFPL